MQYHNVCGNTDALLGLFDRLESSYAIPGQDPNEWLERIDCFLLEAKQYDIEELQATVDFMRRLNILPDFCWDSYGLS
jgi:hypothetical protein